MERYGLFDFSEIAVPVSNLHSQHAPYQGMLRLSRAINAIKQALATDLQWLVTFSDFRMGLGKCCATFNVLLNSRVPRTQMVASQHLIRIASHHLGVSIILESGVRVGLLVVLGALPRANLAMDPVRVRFRVHRQLLNCAITCTLPCRNGTNSCSSTLSRFSIICCVRNAEPLPR